MRPSKGDGRAVHPSRLVEFIFGVRLARTRWLSPQDDGLRWKCFDRMPLRLVFMGTPDFAVPTLLALAAAGHDIAAVYTRAPKPAGRGMELQATPVEREARRLGLDVLTPKTLKDEAAQAGFPRPQGRCRRGGGLWPDPAESRFSKRRSSAASTCMPRCCRAGAAPRRSTAPSWPATAKAASPS